MKKCPICKKELDWWYHSCRFCSKAFCAEHRLPENHSCPGLKFYKKGNAPSDGIVYEKKTMKAKPQEISEIGGPAQKESAFKVWKEKSGEWVGENPALTALILLMLVCSFFVMWAIITKTPLV